MSITLSQLCKNAEKKYGMKLIAGSGGLSNTVRWIHMIEDSEVPDFLHGNEFIFTTGIGHTGTEWLMSFVKNLKGNDSAGLCINLGPYIDVIPSKVIVYCEENNFPLFTIPWRIHIIDITYNFCRRIIDNETTETSIAEAFCNLIFTPNKKDDYVPILERNGFRKNSSYTVLVLQMIKDSEKKQSIDSFELWKVLKRKSTSAQFMLSERYIVIYQNISNNDMNRLINDISAFKHLKNLRIGISETENGYYSISNCYKQALSAISVSEIKNEQITFYRNIGIYKLLLGIENREILSSYKNDILSKLIEYDNMNNTDYKQTLKVYLECSGSVQLTAETLKVHRNTINYKMKIVKEILNIDFSDEEKMKLLLSFRVEEVLKCH